MSDQNDINRNSPKEIVNDPKAMNDENDINRNLPLKSLLGDLRKTSLIFKDTISTFEGPLELKKLNKTLSDKYSKAPELKMNAQALVDLAITWKQIKDNRKYDDLTRREFIMLCSLPDATKEEAFLELLNSWEEKIPFRALPVLLATIHDTWEENANQKSLCYFFSKFVKGYSGNRAYLNAWAKNNNMYLSQEGIKEFAWLLSTEHYDIPTLCSQYHLPSSSSTFVELIRKQAMDNLIKELGKISQYNHTVWNYLFEDLIQPIDFEQLSELILIADKYTKQGNQEAEELLKQWFLNPDHFGDPRIYPGNWELKITQRAKETFIQWLSKEDLAFFFNLLLKKGEDEHGRRAFWEQYLGHVVSSRVLLSDEDWTRNRQVLQDMSKTNKTLPGRIKDNTSAFIMQTKKLVIIEFSEKGNACYLFSKLSMPKTLAQDLTQLYQKNKVFEKWRLIDTKIPELTMNDLRLGIPSVKLRHAPPDGWQTKPRRWLDSQGIRPC